MEETPGKRLHGVWQMPCFMRRFSVSTQPMKNPLRLALGGMLLSMARLAHPARPSLGGSNIVDDCWRGTRLMSTVHVILPYNLSDHAP